MGEVAEGDEGVVKGDQRVVEGGQGVVKGETAYLWIGVEEKMVHWLSIGLECIQFLRKANLTGIQQLAKLSKLQSAFLQPDRVPSLVLLYIKCFH